ncbi:MAG: fimbrillin family protein, partial [Tannerellaceae bacterium]|nr:fimbrillin family protein [Tannerellaceae bacterium]
MKQNVLLLLALAALLGCSKSNLLWDDANGLAIQLSSRINDVGVTRGDGVIEAPEAGSTLEVDIFRADMASPNGSYPGQWEEKVIGSLDSNEEMTLYPTQYYLLDADQKSRFVGVYPQGGTYDKAARTVTYDLDGAMDVICSDIAEGYKGVGTKPELTFSHLLTKIQVWLQVQDTDPDVVDDIIYFRGKVSSIKVVDKKIGAVVTLPESDFAGNLTDAKGTIAATGAPDDLELTAIDGNPLPTLMSGTATPFGYAMFLPSATEETLTLTIGFEDGKTVDVETPTAQKYEASKGYKIVVAFKKAVPVATVLKVGLAWDDNSAPEINNTAPTEMPETYTVDGLSNAYIVAPGDGVGFPVSRAYVWDDAEGVKDFTDKLRVDPTGADYTDKFETEIVWADFDTDTDDLLTHKVTGFGKDALVFIKTKAGAEGNAVVAIKKDGTDEIVWSYHIWVTGYDPKASDATYP